MFKSELDETKRFVQKELDVLGALLDGMNASGAGEGAGALGTVVIVIGGAIAALGFALIYVRSRMKDTPQPSDKTTP